MIIDTLANAHLYENINPLFKKAFEFLATQPLATLPAEKFVLDGDNLYASVQDPEGKTQDTAKLEYHKRYIDIQYVVSGDETMGWSPLEGIGKPQPFDDKKDVGFAADKPMAWFPVRPGSFVIFFPEDAHAPNVGPGIRRKVVVKVLA